MVGLGIGRAAGRTCLPPASWCAGPTWASLF